MERKSMFGMKAWAPALVLAAVLVVVVASVGFGQGATSRVSFANDVVPMFVASCTSCHGGESPSASLNLETNAYDNLVGVYSTRGAPDDVRQGRRSGQQLPRAQAPGHARGRGRPRPADAARTWSRGPMSRWSSSFAGLARERSTTKPQESPSQRERASNATADAAAPAAHPSTIFPPTATTRP